MPSSLDDLSLRSRTAAFSAFLSSLPAEAAANLVTQVETCIDPARVDHYLPEFQSRFPGHFAPLVSNRVRLEWLIAIFTHSRFLSEEVLQHPEWFADVPDVYRVLGTTDYLNRLASFLTLPAASRPNSTSPHVLAFALFRRREICRIVVRDALSLASLSEITEELSNLADAILHQALHAILQEVVERHGAPAGSSPGDPFAGFCVLAVGKLGGRELNYSSDIDLIFLYSANGETAGPNSITNREFYRKVANRYTELLSTYTPEGLCYRVDLRLRPEGKLGEVCISLDGARQYYGSRARDWELQMLIKARVVTGNESIGRDLLEFVEASIYSTSTDFSAIETMSATRERLAEKLTSKRLLRHDLDVKLTRGGIRDIEFLVQCLQRLHGGRQAWVRHGGTLLALSRLLDRDLLSGTEYSRLVGAYHFLRHLEHRLQFEDDRQTHTLPADPAELDRLAKRMPAAIRPNADGVRPGTQLLRDLNHHLENVQVIYDRIVHAQRPLSYGPIYPAGNEQDAPETSAAPSSEPVQDTVHSGLPAELLAVIKRDAPLLSDHLHNLAGFRNQQALQQFLENLAQNREWLQDVNSNPVLSAYVTRIFNLSPYLSEQLTRDLSLLSEVRDVADHPNRRAAFEGLATPLNDLGALRRFFRREMVRIQTASLCLSEPVFQTLDRTSALAEFVIARAYRIALERALDHARAASSTADLFSEPHHEMMVVALGRLGMREFDLASDADLLFIIPNSEVEHQKFWTRVAEHMIEILTAYTGDGAILTIDTRLRPNGREGLLVQTESKYRDYFGAQSEAWEGIALMKARAVAGDVERATVFLTELQEVDWRRWGQSGRSKQDLKQMRLRLEREQGDGNPLKAGHGGYYDADFALMYLRLKGAGLFFKTLNTPERIDIVEKMGHLERADAEFLLRATTFYRALDHGIRLATGHARGKVPASGPELEALTELVELWTGHHPRSEPLAREFAQMRNSMRDLFDRLFG